MIGLKKYHKMWSYSDATENSDVININEFGKYIWFALPNDIDAYTLVYSISDICNKSETSQPSLTDLVIRESMRPWIRIDSDLFSKSPGFHMYKFDFVQTNTQCLSSYYWAYHLQDDCPDKPYLYKEGK